MGSGLALAWSGGKDSAMALYTLLEQGERVKVLLVTYNPHVQRVTMHGVRRALLHQQAAQLGIPLYEVPLPYPCPNAVYEERMAQAVLALKQQGIGRLAFGDIFLEDVRQYRIRHLAPLQVDLLFPIWGISSAALVRRFLHLGFRAITVCVMERLGPAFLGRILDASFLEALPPDVDPAGERGEFHTFVFAGPLLRNPVAFRLGERVLQEGFWYQDLLPLSSSTPTALPPSQRQASPQG